MSVLTGKKRNRNKKLDGKYGPRMKVMPIGSDHVTWEPLSYGRFDF